jgi:prepilin-type N-terminal cleavage/methylation domain-containing protein
MKNLKQLNGFTLIEITVTMMIITILATLAVSTLLQSLPRMRIRSDNWAVYQAVTKAKYLTINENVPYGVMFMHQGGNAPDVFFIFKDLNTPGVYDDTDGNPLVQCNPQATVGMPFYKAGCAEDPIYGDIYQLNSANYFAKVFDTKLVSPGNKAFITFTNLGSVTQMATIVNNSVLIRNNTIINTSTNTAYSGGVTVDMVSGAATIIPPAITLPPT